MPLRQLAAILILLFAGLCTPSAAQEDGTISTGAGTVADREIEQRIEDIFAEIDGLDRVDVTVRSGVVTLGGEVAELTSADQAENVAGRVNGVVSVTNRIAEDTTLSVRLEPVSQRLVDRLAQAVGYIPLFTVAALAWLLVYLAGTLIARASWPWDRIAPNAFIADILRQLLRLVFFVVGIVLALDILGATALLGTILGAAGIAGLAVGFAVRDTVENYIASILLSIRQPFRPEDYVAIEGKEGFVINLTSRATILLDRDGNHIRIPNSTVFKSSIVNYTRNPQRRFLFQLGVDADANLEQAVEIGTAAMAELDYVQSEPGPDAWIDNVGDSNVVLTFVGWIDQRANDFFKARSEAIRLVKLALETNGFGLPEPIYRLRFDPAAVPAASGASEPSATTSPAELTGKAAVAESPLPKDTGVDRSVVKKVAAERAEVKKDLLEDKPPDELNG